MTSIGQLREMLPEYGILQEARFPNAEDVRGAKEQLRKVCSRKRYRPMRDQNVFAKRICIEHLIKEN